VACYRNQWKDTAFAHLTKCRTPKITEANPMIPAKCIHDSPRK
jgi:hypothetical protein